MTRILFVCHGNICRSPMAEAVFRHMVKQRGLSGLFLIRSAATSAEELGSPVHHGAKLMLRTHGIECPDHRARQLSRADYDRYDLIVGMDELNRKNILSTLGGDPAGKVRLMLDWVQCPREIADPWYTGDFSAAYEDITEGCTALLDAIENKKV